MHVLVADDHGLVRESIGMVLKSNDFRSVDYAESLPSALEQVRTAGKYDLILLDYNMPGMNGLDGLYEMLAVADKTPVALLSGAVPPDIVDRALKVGAAGYIPKTLSSRSMVSAARFMIAGEVFAPIDYMQGRAGADPYLSPRENEVLRGICKGQSNKEIARDLDLQEVTIKLYVKTLSRKLGARNRTHAAMIARDMALI